MKCKYYIATLSWKYKEKGFLILLIDYNELGQMLQPVAYRSSVYIEAKNCDQSRAETFQGQSLVFLFEILFFYIHCIYIYQSVIYVIDFPLV